MSSALACCFDPVVAAGAISGNAHVIEIGWQPAGGGVTIVAGIATGNMRRMFSRSGDTVVTGSASTKDLGMIDR